MSLCDNCGNALFRRSHLLPTPAQTDQLRDIIRGNSLPPETSSFRAIIAEVPTELSRYDEEIQRLQSTLDSLRSERSILESYSDGCRSVFSPARSLPTELLTDIFEMCAPQSAYTVVGNTTPEEELARLAKEYLLRLSRVCSRWHGVAINTPSLWSSLTVDTERWGESSASSETLLGLVVSSLHRGADFPLTMNISVSDNDPNERPLLQLLSRYSRRWKHIDLWVDPRALGFLVGAKGNLPILEELILHAGTNSRRSTGDDIFTIAPSLKRFTLDGWPSRPLTLPWEQLRDLNFQNTWQSNQVSVGLGILPLLSRDARVMLEITISPTLLFQPVTSNIRHLFIGVITTDNKIDTETAVSKMLRCLTLPSLRDFELVHPPDGPPLLWSHGVFMAFASRSSLHTGLTSLKIRAVVQDDELLECLAFLTSLECLDISDCEAYEGGHALITDNLLHRLVWRPADETSLVSCLTSLRLLSLMQFQENSLSDLVTSRCRSPRCKDTVFTIYFAAIMGRQRAWSAPFVSEMLESVQQGKLIFNGRGIRVP